MLREKADAITASIGRNNPCDDVKSAAGQIYTSAKRILGLIGVGNDAEAFARNILCPLVTPDTNTYRELRFCIFGK